MKLTFFILRTKILVYKKSSTVSAAALKINLSKIFETSNAMTLIKAILERRHKTYAKSVKISTLKLPVHFTPAIHFLAIFKG